MKPKSNRQQPLNRERPILLGFAVQRKGPDGRLSVSIRWFRLLSTLAILLVIGWLLLSAALFYRFKYMKEFDELTFTKTLVMPFRMKEHRKEMGDYHIKKGLAAMQEGEFRDAIRLLMLGVNRSPDNLEGRAQLAEIYEVAYKQPDVAAEELVKGLALGGAEDLKYMQRTLAALLRHQKDDKIQEIADKYLPKTPEINEINQSLAYGAANANYLRGNYDRADDYLSDYGLLNVLEGLLLSANISWDRGNKIAAISKLESALRRYPNSEPLLIQLSRYHRMNGDLDKARQYAILRNVSDPLSPKPRMELLYIYNEMGDESRERRETARMLEQFGDDRQALVTLADFAAQTGNVALARQCYESALENELSIDLFAMLLIASHIRDADFDGALRFSEELLKERPDWLSGQWAVFNSLRSIASYGVNRPDLGEIYLQNFIDESTNSPQTYIDIAASFLRIDRPEQARRVLLASYQDNPNNQRLLSELIRAELQLGHTDNLNRYITKLLQMRRPEVELLATAYNRLGSDRFLFTPDRESLLLRLSAILREKQQSIAL